MAQTEFDIAIIGGGLAGLSLAIQMRKQGYQVVLFEKEAFPFHKVCGEYIAMESWDFLQSLGLPLTEMHLPRIQHLHISDCSGFMLKHQMNPGGFGISRITLDASLAKLAKKAGTQFHEGAKVTEVSFCEDHHELKTSVGNFSAKLVCGAWGKRSNLDIKLNRPFVHNYASKEEQYIAVKYHIRTDFSPSLIELHNFKNGYCGISTVDRERQCLCYLTTALNLQQCHNSIKELETKVLSQNPHLKHYLSHSNFIYSQPLAISQICFDLKEIVDNHIFMAGDAAGMITPLCGNGMSMALHSSKLLAQTLTDFLEGKTDRLTAEYNYSTLWKSHFNKRIKAGRVFQQLFGNPLITNFTIKTLQKTPTLTSKLVELTHGNPF